MCFSDEEQIEVHSDINGKINDYDILKNVPTIDGVPVHGDITESGRYTDETPTAGSKKLITSGAMRAAMERGDLQGPEGFSPRIEVVNIGRGYRVNITDIDGTKYFDIICGENDPGTHTHDERYYTEAETNEIIAQSQNNSALLISELRTQTDEKLSGKSDKKHTHDEVYYSKEETAVLIDDAKTEALTEVQTLLSNIEAETDKKLAGKSDTDHEHDDRYNTKAEITSMVLETVAGLMEVIDTKSGIDHLHDDRYPTKSAVMASIISTVGELEKGLEEILADKSDKNHTHGDTYITATDAAVLIGDAKEEVLGDAEGLVIDLEAQTETKLAGKSNKNHTHHDLYYTEAETDNLISQAVQSTELLVAELSSETEAKLGNKSDKNHNHGDTYITAEDAAVLISDAKEEVLGDAEGLVIDLEAQTEEKLSGKSNKNHTHHDLYYTEAETDNLISQAVQRAELLVAELSSETDARLGNKSDKNHTHGDAYISAQDAAVLIGDAKEEVLDDAQELVIDLEAQTEAKLAGKSNTDHQHWYLEPQGGGNTVMVTSDGNLYPMVHEGQQLGTTARRWSYILGKYIVGSAEVNGPVVNASTQVNSPLFNNTSDERVKENFDTDMAKYVAMLDLLEPTSYHFKSEADMEDRKRNVGYIAQRVQDAMAEVGLDDTDFGGLCYDTERESKGEFSYGLAYSQFIPILHAKLKQVEEKYDAKIAEYDKKIAELEEKLAMYLSGN